MRALIVALLVVAAPGFAQKRKPPTSTQEAEARSHYQRGLTYYNLREYPIAIVEFKEAYAISSEPLLLFNIAQAYRLDHQYEEALHYYRTYLHTRPNAANRHDAEEFVAEMERLLNTQQALTHERPEAAAPPEKPGTEPPAELPPPELPSPEKPPAPTPQLVAPPAPPVIAQRPHKAVYKRWWVWTVAGAAVAVVGVGLAVGLTTGTHETQLPSGSLGSIDARR